MASYEEKNTIIIELVTQGTDIPILMMTPEVTSFRAELIELGCIGTIKFVL